MSTARHPVGRRVAPRAGTTEPDPLDPTRAPGDPKSPPPGVPEEFPGVTPGSNPDNPGDDPGVREPQQPPDVVATQNAPGSAAIVFYHLQ